MSRNIDRIFAGSGPWYELPVAGCRLPDTGRDNLTGSWQPATGNGEGQLVTYNFAAMQRDFAFIQTAPDRVFVGWGPFEQAPMRKPGRPAFFIADFFLDDPHPWRHPVSWEELSYAEFASRFEDGGKPAVQWTPPSIDEFAPLFESAREAMARGEFRKIVPVLFENGTGSVHWRSFIDRLPSLPPHMW